MSIVALGLNHTTAPLELRERAVVDDAGMPSALRSLSRCPGVSEAAILSTCNRTDLYCGIGAGEDAPTRWFGEFLGIDRRDLDGHLYVHREDAAVRHLMRVASGLDSMVLGEPQILGQLKQAYGTARRAGSLGVVLEKLFQRSFSVAKRVRTDTDIGASPVSVAYAAVTLAHRIFGDLDVRTALLVGAGDTVELCARHLASSRIGRMVIANRTVEHARRIATALGAYAISLDEVPLHLAEADIVISSTASRKTVISFQHTRDALHRRRRRPMFMADLAVPHDIDRDVGTLPDVYLYGVDDLADVIEEGRQRRMAAAGVAEGIIDQQVAEFMAWMRGRRVSSVIVRRCGSPPTPRGKRCSRRPAAGCRAASRRTRSSNTSLAPSPTGCSMRRAPPSARRGRATARTSSRRRGRSSASPGRTRPRHPGRTRSRAMNPSLIDKLEGLRERYAEVGALLAEPEVASDPSRLRSLAREHAELGPIVECFVSYNATVGSIEDAREILAGADPDLRALAEEEIEAAEVRRTSLENELKVLLLPTDPADAGNVYLEIRAGTGGDEAALFAGDLLRMYLRYGELRGWRCEIVSESPGEHGGYREVVVRIAGRGVYSRLKFESGGHRVQRVPETESQGRIHTSACTVAVLPEADEIGEIEIDASDLRIDTFRASGAGGQHVNKTDSAIRNHAPADQHRGRVPGRALAAQEPGAGDVAAEVPSARGGARAQGHRAGADEAAPRRQRRPLAAHPHLQLPAGAGDGSPHQPHPLQAGRHHGRRPRGGRRGPGARGPGGSARGARFPGLRRGFGGAFVVPYDFEADCSGSRFVAFTGR